MSDRAKIDAFLSATDAMVSGLGVCSPVERGEDRMGTVVATTKPHCLPLHPRFSR
jgi:hypothetical protein